MAGFELTTEVLGQYSREIISGIESKIKGIWAS